MKMLKNKFVFVTVILSGLLVVFSCNQDPIFFKISNETLPKKPRVQGGPTNIVEFTRNSIPTMYVASGSIHWYNRYGWDSSSGYIPPLSGRVIGLAATKDHLYALSISDTGVIATLWRIGPTDPSWGVPIPILDSTYILIQTIFADPSTDKLFAGARNNKGNDYGILYASTSLPGLRLLKGSTEMLTGAANETNNASGNYYLSTGFPDTGKKGGVYKVDSSLSSIAQPLFGKNIMGMIKLEGTGTTIKIYAIERENGMLYMATTSGGVISTNLAAAPSKWSTGAMSLWEDGSYRMLIVGIQGGLYSTSTSSSFKHGYVEFYLNTDNTLDYFRPRNDPPTITVANSDQYQGSLGKHPINFIHQTSTAVDPARLFFASTQTAGLWSYKLRSGVWQWNAEE